MMFNGTAARALEKAQLALDEARKSTAMTEGHMAECSIRHEQIQKSLASQDKILCDIKDVLKWATRGVIVTLITVLGYVGTSAVTHVQFHP